MALTYAVLGSGAMGLRFGLLLKEHLGVQVDFIDTWEEQIDTIRKQGGVYQSRDGKNRHLIPISIQTPEVYQGKPDVFIILINKCICHSCSNEVSISSMKINMFSQE